MTAPTADESRALLGQGQGMMLMSEVVEHLTAALDREAAAITRAEAAEAEVARLREALERIASHNAFLVATPDIDPELEARMKYARAALAQSEGEA